MTPRARHLVGLSLGLVASLGCPSGDNNGPGPVAVDRVTVSPPTLSLLVGAQQALSATALAANGAPIAGKAAAWSSDNTTAATVGATTGLVTAVGPGSAVIAAVIDGMRGQATVEVSVPLQRLTVTTGGTGEGTVTSSPAGISCTRTGGTQTGTCAFDFPQGTSVTLTATPAAGGHSVGSWAGEGCTGTAACQVNLGQARAVTASFIAPFTLAVTTAGSGNGTVTSVPAGIACSRSAGVESGNCMVPLVPGTAMTLTATPAAGHLFTGWTGGGCIGTAPCQLTIDQPRSVTATFVPAFTLTVLVAGGGSGMVISAPGGIACGSTSGTSAGNCAASYASGTSVVLTAQGTAGSIFAGWTGEGCSGTAPCQVTLSQARTVTARFVPTFPLDVQVTGPGAGTIVSLPAGISCGRAGGVTSGTCSALFPEGTTVSLTVAPAGGTIFTGWSGEGCVGTAACVVQMDRARTVGAGLGTSLDIVVNVTGDGDGTVTSSPAGINCARLAGIETGQCSLTVAAGTVLTLQAVAATGHEFLAWGGESCQGAGTCQVTVSLPTAVAATFTVRKATLTVATAGAGGGVVSSEPAGVACQREEGAESGICTAEFPLATTVLLQALAAPGHQFTGWSGAGCAGTGTCLIALAQATQVTASFSEITETLTIVTSGSGAGTVTSTPAGLACTRSGGVQGGICAAAFTVGTGVTLVAQASAGSLFLGWIGGGCSGTGSCSVTMAQAAQVSAAFGLPQQLLTVAVAGIGNGTIASAPAGILCSWTGQVQGGTCTAAFDAGSSVTLTATPTGAHAFAGWTGGSCSGTGSCQVTLSQSQQVTGTFTIPLGIGFGPEQWVSLPAGTYIRGSASGTADNQPPHTVILTQSIRMLRTEVTMAQYSEAVFGTNPATLAPGFRLRPWDGGDPADVQFNFLDGLNQRDPGKGYRLPTEAEWEYAARAGSTADAPANLSAVAWYGQPPNTGPQLVAQKQPNAWGLHDMLGNLWELVQDNWGLYPSGTVTDPVGSPTPGSHVIRGGAFHLPASSVNHFIRQSYAYSGSGLDMVGFRIVSTGGGQYQLTVSLTGTGSGSVTSFGLEVDCRLVGGVQSGDCTHTGGAGTTLSMVATAGSGSTFVGWSGAGCGGNGGCVVSFNQPLAVTGRFDAPFSVAIASAGTGPGAGTVTSVPTGLSCNILPGGTLGGTCQAAFASGTLVTLTPAPATNGPYTFAGWSGDCSGTGTCALVVGGPKLATASFAYSPGALAVTITGLPAGAQAAVTATGPGGISFPAPTNRTLTDLAAGSWTVTAGAVTSGGTTYVPTPATQTVQVTLGNTTPVSVAYAPGPPPTLNLRIHGAYLTQGIQEMPHSAELLAGRDAYLRVFVVANQANTTTPRVRVKLWHGNTEVWGSFISANTGSVTQSVNEGDYASSWNIRVPGNLIQPGLRFWADVDPDGTVPEANEGDNQFPAPGQVFAVTVRALPRFEITLVPVFQTATALTGNVTISNVESYLRDLRRMLPVENTSLSWEVLSVYTNTRPALSGTDISTWSAVLSDIDALRQLNGSSRYYYGVVKVNYGSGLAGLARQPGQPPTARAAMGWDYGNSRANVLAHEIGHNFGRPHAPCGSAQGVDPGYPYSGGSIGAWGMETEALALFGGNLFLTKLHDPYYYRDVMGYCPSYPWVSVYNWNLMMAWRAASPGGSPPMAITATGPDDGLLVWGQISNRGLILEPAFRTRPTGEPLPRTGSWRIEGRDAAGALLFTQPFEPDELADLPGPPEYQFSMVLPLGDATLDRLAALRVVGPGRSAERVAAGGPPGGPTIPAARPVSGAVRRLTWDVRQYPGALVRDAATGQVLSIARGGDALLVTGAGELDVQFSDGIQIARRRVTVR